VFRLTSKSTRLPSEFSIVISLLETPCTVPLKVARGIVASWPASNPAIIKRATSLINIALKRRTRPSCRYVAGGGSGPSNVRDHLIGYSPSNWLLLGYLY